MNQIINQFSSIWIAAGLVLLAALFLFRSKPKPADYVAMGAIVLGLFVAWGMLHPTQTPLMDDAKMVQALIGQGKPVLIEFQSPY
jgi:hypothetical protein